MNEYQELALILINHKILDLESELAGLKATRTRIELEAGLLGNTETQKTH